MRIGHYAPEIWANGGIATYIRRLGQAQVEVGHVVFYFGRAETEPDGMEPSASGTYLKVQDDLDLFKQARGVQLDILHLHKHVNVLPADRVPTVRTMHGHQGSCPSGSRYLSRTEQPCNRAYHVGGCLWGHLVDGCGRRRFTPIREGFERIQKEMHLASVLPTFTVSQFLRDQMIRSGCSPDYIYPLLSPSPRVEEPFQPLPREGRPRFLFLGRIVPQKGVQWLLRAAASAKADVHLDIAGEGYLLEDMQQLALSLGLAERVTFHGWVSPSKVRDLILAARAVVFPSLWHEPAGLVTLEAAAWGRPVIASEVGGIPEYATSEFSLLVPPNDVSQLAESITLLAHNAEQAEQMGREALHLARTRFSIDKFMHKLESLYSLALSGFVLEEAERL